jgi:hypothetical protein
MATTQKVLQRAPQTRLLIRNPIALAQLFNTDERRLQSMTPVLV